MTRNTVLVAAIVAALGLGAALWFTLEPAEDQVAGRAAPSPAADAKPGDAGGGQNQTQGQQPTSQTADAGGAGAAPVAGETQMAAAPASPPAASAPAAEPAASAPADSAPAAEPAPEPPSFDIVRVEKDGSAVIAGRAPAGSTITLLDGETPLGSAKAGADGSFALVLDQPLAPGSRALSLAATTPEGTIVPSAGEVVVMVPEVAPATTVASAAATQGASGTATGGATTASASGDTTTSTGGSTATEAAAQAGTAVASTAESTASETTAGQTTDGATIAGESASSEAATTQVAAAESAPADTTTQAAESDAAGAGAESASGDTAAATAPATPLVVASGPEGASVVLQAPGGDLTGDTLRIEAVDYDLEGQVIVSGRAPAGAAVALYLDGALLGQAAAGADGRWVFKPDAPVAAGLHRLRADQLAPDGAVTARAEIPFSRAEPLQLAANEDFVIVQPGNSLWVIARGKYGEGIRYSTIYEANSGQIRNPDLIYPGQIFLVPQVN